MNFKSSLHSREQFKVEVSAFKEGNLRVVFKQDILRLSDNKVALSAQVKGVCLVNGRPVKPESLPEVAKFLEAIEA